MLVYSGIILFFIAIFPYIVYFIGIFSRKPAPPPNPPEDLPPITMIISAYNEEKVIPDRVRNLMGSSLPEGEGGADLHR